MHLTKIPILTQLSKIKVTYSFELFLYTRLFAIWSHYLQAHEWHGLMDKEIFEDDIGKVRQLLGGLSLLILKYEEAINELMDRDTFNILYKEENNRHVLQLISHWFTNPSFKILESDHLRSVINVLKSILKRFYSKNIYHRVVLVRDDGVLTVAYQQ